MAMGSGLCISEPLPTARMAMGSGLSYPIHTHHRLLHLVVSNLVSLYYFLFRGATSSVVEPPIRYGLAITEENSLVTSSNIEPTIRKDEKEVNQEDVFVPETQVDALDYINISSDVDTVLEMQMDLDSDSVTKPSDRY